MEAGISVESVLLTPSDMQTMSLTVEKGLQQLTDNPNKVTREFGIKINLKTTKMICISLKRNNKLKIYVD